MRGLILGVKELDDLFGGFQMREFVVFHGSWMGHILSEMLCVRCQLPICEGGLDSTMIFIDGGNIFDPYFIAETLVN